MTEIEHLEKTIFDLHGCKSRHSGSIAVHETFQGQTAWRGVVEVFELADHPQAKIAYAWSYKADDRRTRYVAVLRVSPIDSPNDAVRAYIAAQGQKK
jgi:hypothetical protein